MTEKAPPVANQSALLEQYLLLAKSAKGAAAVELIKQVLEVPGIYVFGELLDMPNIQELENTPNGLHLQLLHIFAYGTYATYLENKDKLPTLSPAMANKLRHLTIVSLATKLKCIPYSKLLQELDLRNLRELEDLIIEVIYADIVRGKLDQKNNQLEVDFTIGRDIRPDDIDTITSVLQEWCETCDNVVSNIEAQINRANSTKDSQVKLKMQIENEVNNIKKTLKTQSQDSDEQMPMDIREALQSEKPSKNRPTKTRERNQKTSARSERDTGKLWSKNT